MKKIRRIIIYFKDVKWFLSLYPKWYKEKTKKITFRNALYCVAPHNWKLYNRFLESELICKFCSKGVK